MTVGMLHALGSLIASLAGLAIGLSAIIVVVYWRVWRASSNGQRLVPAHVMAIGASYAMLAVAAVVRIDEVPPWTESDIWWTYPLIAAAFALGDAALLLILLFLRRRGRTAGES